MFWVGGRHEEEAGRGMLCVPVHATPGEERMVEIESGSRRAADGRGQNDARGLAAYNSVNRREVAALPSAMPKALEETFRKQGVAWANYEKFPPGYRRVTAGWVASAKKEETRIKRLEKLIEFSARNERIEFM